MTNFYSIEAQIKNDWSVFRAWVALNPYWAICVASCVGWLVGKVL